MRPSVHEPVARLSVDFASLEMMGSKKRHFILDVVFAFKLVDLSSQKEVDTQDALSPAVKFTKYAKSLFFVKFAAGISSTVSHQQGVTVVNGFFLDHPKY